MSSTRDGFFANTTIAVVGVSREKGFANVAFHELRKKGYRVFPVNRETDTVEGEKCYRRLADLPESVRGVLIVTPPDETESVVADCAKLGIKRVWMQQGAESVAAIQRCDENGITVVDHACILMYDDPIGMHKLHRWFWNVLGKL